MAPTDRADGDHPACPNCATDLPQGARYCPVCGQDQRARVVPIKGLVMELLQDWFAADPKFFRTVPLLLFRPGRLVNEFVAGRRARYVPPIRLYVFISLVAFFFFSLDADHPYIVSSVPEEVPAGTFSGHDIELTFTGPSVSLAAIRAEIDRMGEQAWLERNVLQGPWTGRILNKAGYLLVKGRDREVLDRLRRQLPLTLLVVIPFLALLIQLFQWRLFYVVHLVFSFHLASFFLLSAALLHVLDSILGTSLVGMMTLVFPLYLALAIRHVYGAGFLRSMVVTTVLLALFLVFLLLALLISMAFAVVVI